MSVSVETLSGLERKVTVLVPADKIEEEVGQRLKHLAVKVKIHGFRPGRAPMNIIKQRYSTSVRQEVARDMVQSTLYEALKENHLIPAGQPFVEPGTIESNQDFQYTATFEVYPQFDIVEFDQDTIELIQAKINDADVNKVLEELRKQNTVWHEVTRLVQIGDKVVIDFEGFIDEQPFEGGQAKDYELVIGSGTMVPGFEDSLVGLEKNKPTDINVKFPDDYGHATLAGKPARFKITVTKIMEGELPPLDDTFAEKFNVESGLDDLRQDIKENMERELDRRLSTMNREAIFEKLLEKNEFDTPKALVDQEIEHLKHEMYHRIFGAHHSDHEKIPDFPRELFEEQAIRRVRLGLLFSEYVKKHQIVVDKARVDAMIDKFASAYEKPEELRAWYQGSKERLGEIEVLVMEEMVAEIAVKNAQVTHKSLTYDEVINTKASKGVE